MDCSVLNPELGTRKQVWLSVAPSPQFGPTGLYSVCTMPAPACTKKFGWLNRLNTANSADVGRMVLRQSGLPVVVGVLAGLAMAAALTPLLSGLLYGVRPSDPLTYGAISVVLAAVGILACYIPARRATKVDPMIALRCE